MEAGDKVVAIVWTSDGGGCKQTGHLMSWKSWSVVEGWGQAMGVECSPGPQLPRPLP